MPRENVAGALQGGADDLGDVHQIQPQLDRAEFQAGRVEQVADKSVEALGLPLKRGKQFVALGRIVFVGPASAAARGHRSRSRSRKCASETVVASHYHRR
jgi:hypothetical protein